MRVKIAIGLITALAFAPTVAAKGNAHHWQTSPHHLSALVGTTYTEECGNAFTLGIDYEYRISDFLGLGFVAEYAFEDLDAYTYLLVADLHITNRFIAQIGPGVEFHGSHKMEVARLGFYMSSRYLVLRSRRNCTMTIIETMKALWLPVLQLVCLFNDLKMKI